MSYWPRRVSLLLLAVPWSSVSAEPEIYRCEQDDGTVAFQQTPCAPTVAEESPDDEPAETATASDDFFDFENPYDAPPEPPQQPGAAPVAPSGDRQQCEKETRDAIDAIDLKLQQSNSSEDDRAYLAELLELTRRLRQCKQL